MLLPDFLKSEFAFDPISTDEVATLWLLYYQTQGITAHFNSHQKMVLSELTGEFGQNT